MATVTKKADQGRSRSDTLNMRIDPKVKYLAELAARETQRTLSGFIEWAIKRALTVEAMAEDEPTPGEAFIIKQAPPLYNEGFWDVDESDRFFKLASFRPDLLTIEEQRMWKLFQLCETDGKGIQAFRDFWNHPMIDTAHLQATASEGGK